MLTKEDNEMLTRVGPGTPCGELLRRYWHPVCIASELTEDRPKKRLRVLGEDLVIFRDEQGGYGLLAEQCSHRGASLYYGFLEDGGLRCPYHGWLYDATGTCLEQPFEPSQSMLKHSIRHPAYPVQQLAGLLFAFMGPKPASLLPRWDVVAWEDGERTLSRQQILSCNWLQAEENTADVTHTYFLHGHTMRMKGRTDGEYYYRPIEQYGFQRFEYGLVKSWRYADNGSRFGAERGGGNPLVFPNMLRLTSGPTHSIHWRVPIDDVQTRIFVATFSRSGEGRRWGAERPEGEQPSIDERMDVNRDPNGEYSLDTFPSQDTMAWETQGPIFDRTKEHLGASDRGVAMFRQMLKEQIEIVQRGAEPMGVIRDPEKNQLIELPGWVVEGTPDVVSVHGGTSPRVKSMDTVFDERHEIMEVPFGKARPRPSS
ncbi:MAG: Rieske 2Fe-2S domain-containing protein [Chloroflexi bacterium]|nr:Rieske 2Fe-2S domain-containing protein [Chloroflexota bacterium]